MYNKLQQHFNLMRNFLNYFNCFQIINNVQLDNETKN